MNKRIIVTGIICLLVPVLLSASCASTAPENEEKGGAEDQTSVVTVPQEEETEDTGQVTDEGVINDEEETPEPEQTVIEEPIVTEEEKPAPEPIPEDGPVPVHKYQELVEYALVLINNDRIANGLDPVELRGNTASQLHAEESLANAFTSHWNLEGLKPYMRYTQAGGVNYVGENVIGTGIETAGDSTESRDIEELLVQAEEKFMESPLHRANILNKWNKTVSIGIAYDDTNFQWVQHFEGDYIGFSTSPVISGTTLSLAGKVKTGTFEQINVYYDPLPQTLTSAQLNAPPYNSSYSLGEECGHILPPLPEGSYYTNLGPTDLVATKWESWDGGWFDITAEIGPILIKGNGVYTIVVLAKIAGELVPISNYSIFIQ